MEIQSQNRSKLIKICPHCAGDILQAISNWKHFHHFTRYRTCSVCKQNLTILQHYDNTSPIYKKCGAAEQERTSKKVKMCPSCDFPPICAWKPWKIEHYDTWRICKDAYENGCDARIIEFRELPNVVGLNKTHSPSLNFLSKSPTTKVADLNIERNRPLEKRSRDEASLEKIVDVVSIPKRRRTEVLLSTADQLNGSSQSGRKQPRLTYALPTKPQCTNPPPLQSIEHTSRALASDSTSKFPAVLTTMQQGKSLDAKTGSTNTVSEGASSSIYSQRNGRLWNKMVDATPAGASIRNTEHASCVPNAGNRTDDQRQYRDDRQREHSHEDQPKSNKEVNDLNENTSTQHVDNTDKVVRPAQLSASLLRRHHLYYGKFGLLRFRADTLAKWCSEL